MADKPETTVLAQTDSKQIGAWSLVRYTKTRKLYAVNHVGRRIGPLKADEAREIARGWRDTTFPGAWFEAPDAKFAAAL